MKYFLCLLTTLIIGTMPSLAFADYEKGTAAFEQSDYETALREFKILAKQKDPRGQYGLGLLYDLGAEVFKKRGYGKKEINKIFKESKNGKEKTTISY